MPAILEAPNRPELQDQTAFNLAVWEKLLADPFYATLEHRIETDAHGQIIMSPPPNSDHGESQSNIAYLLRTKLPGGKAVTECPISTSKGVRAADVAWVSKERRAAHKHPKGAYTMAPEICVEVISPSNTPGEMAEKKALYFEAGAEEVWFIDEEQTLSFFLKDAPDTPAQSRLCPEFPKEVPLD